VLESRRHDTMHEKTNYDMSEMYATTQEKQKNKKNMKNKFYINVM